MIKIYQNKITGNYIEHCSVTGKWRWLDKSLKETLNGTLNGFEDKRVSVRLKSSDLEGFVSV